MLFRERVAGAPVNGVLHTSLRAAAVIATGASLVVMALFGVAVVVDRVARKIMGGM